MSREPFRRRELIRFQHCDPAGIVFYPRYVEMLNASVEDWFAAVVGVDFARLHVDMAAAIPAVTLKLDFKVPSRIGETLTFEVAAEKLGRTSVSLTVAARHEDELRFEGWVTLVHVPKATFRPAPWPENIRAAIAAQVEPASDI